jgi:hypothetical protein
MPEKDKTLEMRVAEIEDKLAQLHITDEEMKAYNKVASAMGMATGAASAAGSQAAPVRPIAVSRYVCVCRIVCIINPCICPCGPGVCNECTCGPCIQGGGGGFGGGFGGFGS